MKIYEKIKTVAGNFRLEPTQLVFFVYIMLLFSKTVVGIANDNTNEYLLLIILQILTFAIPAAIWYRLRLIPRFSGGKRTKFRARLRFERPRLHHIVIIISAVFMLISGGLLFSFGISGRSYLEGSFSLYETFVSRYDGTPFGAVWLILAYAAIPAFCEELVFRGFVCSEAEENGVVCSVAVSTLWFGLLHFNFAALPVYLFAGVVLSVLLYATRSLYAVIIVHFLYNVFGLFGQPYLTEFYVTAGSTGVLITILIIILLISSALFCGASRRLYAGYAKKGRDTGYPVNLTGDGLTRSFRRALITPAAACCVVVFLVATIIGLFI